MRSIFSRAPAVEYLYSFLARSALCNPQFGFVPSYQVFATKFSDLCEFEVAKKIINGLIPVNRDFDKVELKFEGPQEEELAIADRVPYSVFHCYCFPKNLKDLLRYVTLEGVPQHEIDRLRIAYSTVLRKAHLVMNGKQLLIKNPANTGRMHELMSWFPGCKFIHIYRNPYATARSYLHMNQTMCRACSLQDFDDNLVWRNTLESIATVEGKYLKDRPTMPPGTLAEVKYEEFMQNPVQELARVYKELNIQGFEAAAPKFQQFLKTQAEFQPNVFKWKRELVADVNDSCGFLFEPYGYQKLSPADMDSVVDPKTSNSKLSQKDTTAEKKTE
ncbi:sulfotransferase family protein [Pelomyxa schiedti]|nr:sulfotransferase family protein [Pelomyxa schiedti]